MSETVTLVTRELESQSLNAIVAGFSFAAALSWMDLVRWIVNQVVKVKNGEMNYTLTALLTTLLSCLQRSCPSWSMLVSPVFRRVSKSQRSQSSRLLDN